MSKVILLIFILLSIDAKADKIELFFYLQKIEIEYAQTNLPESIIANKKNVSSLFNKLQHSNYSILLLSLQRYRDKLNLNDWLYYSLIKKSIDTIYLSISENVKVVLIWFLLGESGINTKIYFEGKSIRLVAISNDEVFDISKSSNKGYCINCSRASYKLKDVGLNAYVNGRNFCFYFTDPPSFSGPAFEKAFIFVYGGREYHLNYSVNSSLIKLYDEYPKIKLSEIAKASFSEAAQNSILSFLKSAIDSLNGKEAANLLLSFTRQLVEYREDKIAFNVDEKWMAPELVLYYQQGDCEDRTSLYYGLVKALLGVQIRIIHYPEIEHVNCAINLKIDETPDLHIDGQSYYICEPTTENLSEKVGDSDLIKRHKFYVE